MDRQAGGNHPLGLGRVPVIGAWINALDGPARHLPGLVAVLNQRPLKGPALAKLVCAFILQDILGRL